MTDFAAVLWVLGTFILLLLLLAWFSRTISILFQQLIFAVTHSKDAPALAIFLLFLPGVILHEAAHWLMARALGLRTGKFRVWPRRQGRHIGLGSVSVESRNAFLDSLVGMAPLMAGSALVALIATYAFDAVPLAAAVGRGDLRGGWDIFRAALSRPDGALWAYLLFAVANAMMPSASDREPLQPVIVYAIAAAALYILLGMPLQGLAAAMLWAMPALQALSAGLLFTVILDLLVAAVLYVLILLSRPISRPLSRARATQVGRPHEDHH